jgi:hypothetical protein
MATCLSFGRTIASCYALLAIPPSSDVVEFIKICLYFFYAQCYLWRKKLGEEVVTAQRAAFNSFGIGVWGSVGKVDPASTRRKQSPGRHE